MRVRLRNCGGRLQFAPSLRRTARSTSLLISSATNHSSSSWLAASAYNLLPKALFADAARERLHARGARSRSLRCCPPANVHNASCSSVEVDSDQQPFRAAAVLAAAAAGAVAWIGSFKQRGATRGKQHATLWWGSDLRIDEHAAANKRAALPCCSAASAASLAFSPAAKGLWGGPPAACQQQQQTALFKQQMQQQQLALTRAFENIRHAVVQVYAVLPRHRNHADAKSASQHLRDFRFLGSGFFFDDREAFNVCQHLMQRPNDGRSEGEGPPNNEDALKQQRTKKAVTTSLNFPLAVKDSNGRLLAASLCGVDEATDIAVLRLEGASPARDKISSLQGKFSPSTPQIGEPVVIYAAAQHAEEPIGAVGRVLQPRQSFKNISESSCGCFLHLQLLTLPGMSGAPVCDLDGFVVGMLVKKFDVCGLALSAPLVLRVAEALRDAGAFSPPTIGLLVEDVAPDFAFEGDQRLSSAGGVRVCSVAPGSAAAEAGLREGDRILVARGEATKSVTELREVVLLQKKGPFDLKVERGEETLDLRVDVKA
ncbi:hypothetical protein Emag_003614 [Eimeria magna]